MVRKHLLVLPSIMLLFNISTVNAESCDTEDMKRLKNLADHIDVSYTLDENYRIENDDGSLSEPLKGMYIISVANLTDDIYLYDKSNNKNYLKNNNEFVTITGKSGGTSTYEIYSKTCGYLKELQISPPKYNFLSENTICEGVDIKKIEMCDPWYQGETNIDLLKKEIEKYESEKNIQKEPNKYETIIKFLKNNYIYIIGTITVISILIINIIVSKKRGELK